MFNTCPALLFIGLVLFSPVTAQMVHRGAFFTDITPQLPSEMLKQGRVITASSNGKEIILLAQLADTTAFYRQAAGGRFVQLIADNDSRIKGKLSSRPIRSDLIVFSSFEHSPHGLVFITFKTETSFLESSAYFIKTGSAIVEPVAVTGETVIASDGFAAFPISIRTAGQPSVSRDGKRMFLYLGAFQPPNRSRSGIYAVEEGKYKLLLRSDYPMPFTILYDFGIREDEKGRLWFIEIRYNRETDSSDFFLTVFNPSTGEKRNIYKNRDPILGEKADYVTYARDDVSQELCATTGFYDLGQQKHRGRIVSLDLSSFPDEIFKLLFSIPSQFQDGTPVFVSAAASMGREMGIIQTWISDPVNNEFVLGLWNGENISVILKEGDRLSDGKQVGKLSHKISYHYYSPTTVAGCEGTIFTFNPDGTVQYWLKFNTPCIQQVPASAKAGEEIISLVSG